MKQQSLFSDAIPEAIPAVDPNTLDSDARRLEGQNWTILERLREGPASVDELSRLARKYTSRISDIRAHLKKHEQRDIACERRPGGNNLYRIIELNKQ